MNDQLVNDLRAVAVELGAVDRMTVELAAQEIERLRTLFRVNMIRLAPNTPHEEIDRILNLA